MTRGTTFAVQPGSVIWQEPTAVPGEIEAIRNNPEYETIFGMVSVFGSPAGIERMTQVDPLLVMRISCHKLFLEHRLGRICENDHAQLSRDQKQEVLESSNRMGKQGLKFFRDGNYTVALGLFKLSYLLALKSSNQTNSEEAKSLAAIAYNLGSTYLKLNRTAEAIPFLEKALTLRREHADTPESIVKVEAKLDMIRLKSSQAPST